MSRSIEPLASEVRIRLGAPASLPAWTRRSTRRQGCRRSQGRTSPSSDSIACAESSDA